MLASSCICLSIHQRVPDCLPVCLLPLACYSHVSSRRRGRWVVLSGAETHWRGGVGTNRIVFKVMCAATVRRCSAPVSTLAARGQVVGKGGGATQKLAGVTSSKLESGRDRRKKRLMFQARSEIESPSTLTSLVFCAFFATRSFLICLESISYQVP